MIWCWNLLIISQEDFWRADVLCKRAVERFYRADNARDVGAQGSGLGLAIAKWIVDSHGGVIGVTSVEGVGSRFTIRLPR